MIYINIDTRPLIEPFLVDKESIRNITQSVVEGVSWALYNEIREKASSDLRSTRPIYLRNLVQPDIGPLKGTIVLTGSLPNMLEQGATAFDMKEGFLKSSKAKQGKDGNKYLTIPFRWAGAGSLGESEAFSGVLPTEIQAMLKGIKASKTIFGGKKVIGSGLDVKGTKFGSVLTRGAFQNLKTKRTFGSYTHKTPMHQGITKQWTTYEKAMQTQYMSFRRVSLASDKNSWIHPGMTAKKFFERAHESLDIESLMGNIIDQELEILGI